MPSIYYAKLTPIGEAKLANAIALEIPLQITQMGVGDGNGAAVTPEAIVGGLANERRRAALNTLALDSLNANQIIAEQVIPEEVGGWYIREIGLYDAAGSLIAVANCPETYKPVLAEGSGRTQIIRMVLIVSSTSAVQLKIDPAVVLATRGYVDAAVLTVSAALVAHAARNDNPHGTTKAQVGLGSVENYGIATQAESEAESGQSNIKYMTPLRVWQAIGKALKEATEGVAGIARIATQAQVNAGADDATIVTPKKLRFGFAASLQANGYIMFPSWLGGFVIQWGSGTTGGTTSPNLSLTLPMAWPTGLLLAGGFGNGWGATCEYVSSTLTTLNLCYRSNGTIMNGNPVLWFALGR